MTWVATDTTIRRWRRTRFRRTPGKTQYLLKELFGVLLLLFTHLMLPFKWYDGTGYFMMYICTITPHTFPGSSWLLAMIIQRWKQKFNVGSKLTGRGRQAPDAVISTLTVWIVTEACAYNEIAVL